MTDKPFQRIGSISNTHAGEDFESVVAEYFASQGVPLLKKFPVEVGLSGRKKKHKFDLGSQEHKILVECKSHTWTSGGNVPSAKMTVWNEAMLYFLSAPSEYRKILAVLKDKLEHRGETLASYYLRTYAHLIPEFVEIWEFDLVSGEVGKLHPL